MKGLGAAKALLVLLSVALAAHAQPRPQATAFELFAAGDWPGFMKRAPLELAGPLPAPGPAAQLAWQYGWRGAAIERIYGGTAFADWTYKLPLAWRNPIRDAEQAWAMSLRYLARTPPVVGASSTRVATIFALHELVRLGDVAPLEKRLQVDALILEHVSGLFDLKSWGAELADAPAPVRQQVFDGAPSRYWQEFTGLWQAVTAAKEPLPEVLHELALASAPRSGEAICEAYLAAGDTAHAKAARSRVLATLELGSIEYRQTLNSMATGDDQAAYLQDAEPRTRYPNRRVLRVLVYNRLGFAARGGYSQGAKGLEDGPLKRETARRSARVAEAPDDAEAQLALGDLIYGSAYLVFNGTHLRLDPKPAAAAAKCYQAALAATHDPDLVVAAVAGLMATDLPAAVQAEPRLAEARGKPSAELLAERCGLLLALTHGEVRPANLARLEALEPTSPTTIIIGLLTRACQGDASGLRTALLELDPEKESYIVVLLWSAATATPFPAGAEPLARASVWAQGRFELRPDSPPGICECAAQALKAVEPASLMWRQAADYAVAALPRTSSEETVALWWELATVTLPPEIGPDDGARREQVNTAVAAWLRQPKRSPNQAIWLLNGIVRRLQMAEEGDVDLLVEVLKPAMALAAALPQQRDACRSDAQHQLAASKLSPKARQQVLAALGG